MPTLVRSVRKVVLFVLVMAVSGVGVAQAQTDPDIVPTNNEAADSSSCLFSSSSSDTAMANRPAATGLTSDMAQQLARRYATGEQARPATTSGNLTHIFTSSLEVSDGWILHKAVWDFYAINGADTNFFVDTVTTAQQRRLSTGEEYRITEFGGVLAAPSLAEGTPSTARLVSWAPDSAVLLPDLDQDTIFSVTYDPNVMGLDSATISRRVPPSPHTRLESSALPDSQNVPFYHSTTVTYLRPVVGGDPNDPTEAHPDIFVGGSVAHWNCGSLQGMRTAISGEAVSSLTGETHRWSKVGEVQR